MLIFQKKSKLEAPLDFEYQSKIIDILADLAVYGFVGDNNPGNILQTTDGKVVGFRHVEFSAAALCVGARHACIQERMPIAHPDIISMTMSARAQPEGDIIIPVSMIEDSDLFLSFLKPRIRAKVAHRIKDLYAHRCYEIGTNSQAEIFEAYFAPVVRRIISAALGWEPSQIFPVLKLESIGEPENDLIFDSFICTPNDPSSSSLFVIGISPLFYKRHAAYARKIFNLSARNMNKAIGKNKSEPMVAITSAILTALQINFLIG